MKNKSLILLCILAVSLSACSQEDSSDSTPAATKAMESTITADTSSKTESEQEESSYDIEKEKYYEMLSNLEREYGSMQEFIDSGFIEEYYKTLDIPYEYIVPKTDDTVKNNSGVIAHYTSYSTGYEYNGLEFGVSFDVNFTKYDEEAKKNLRYESIEDLFGYYSSFTYDDMEFTLDKDRQIIIRTSPNNTEGPCIIKYSPGGYPYNFYAKAGTDVDLLIEASEHIYFKAAAPEKEPEAPPIQKKSLTSTKTPISLKRR